MDIKVVARKGVETFGRTFWGSTGVPVEAKVRAVGTKAYIVVMGIAKEIS